MPNTTRKLLSTSSFRASELAQKIEHLEKFYPNNAVFFRKIEPFEIPEHIPVIPGVKTIYGYWVPGTTRLTIHFCDYPQAFAEAIADGFSPQWMH